MKTRLKTTALSILLSLGVTGCLSTGGSSSNNGEQTKQIEALKQQVESEQAALKKAQETTKQEQDAKAQLEAELQTAKQNLATLEANYQQAQQNLAEAQKQAEAEATTSQEKLTQAQTELAQTKTALEQAKQTLKDTEAQLQTAKTQKAEVETNLNNANAELDKLKQALREAQVALNQWSASWRYLGKSSTANSAERVSISRSNLDMVNLADSPISYDIAEKDAYLNGQKVGKLSFINQTYSSYSVFTPEDKSIPLDDRNAPYYSSSDFVFIPTNSSSANIVQSGAKATYTGKSIDRNAITRDGKDYPGSVTSANFSLSVDFGNNTVEGKISERENGKPDIILEKGIISSSRENSPSTDPNIANSYFMPYFGFDGVARTYRNDGRERVGTYMGFFAGSEAQEVVGSIHGVGGQITFGGKR